MKLSENNTVAELRSELDRKRKKALELQMNTSDPEEWSGLNSLRWELEDLDKDLYLAQFIKNSDKLAKLVNQIESAAAEAQKLVKTLAEIEQVLKDARGKLKAASPLLDELSSFLDEVEETLQIIKV